jgi:hypothetical protein
MGAMLQKIADRMSGGLVNGGHGDASVGEVRHRRGERARITSADRKQRPKGEQPSKAAKRRATNERRRRMRSIVERTMRSLGEG